MKIFIANVPHELDESELKRLLTEFGQVASVKLVTDKDTGKRLGYGFIEMPVEAQAHAAITALNGKKVHGREIALKENTQPQKERPSYPKREYNSSEGRRNKEVDGNRW